MNVLARHRVAAGITAIVLVLLGGGGFVAWTVAQRDSAQATATPPERGGLLFVDLESYQGQVEQVALDEPGKRTPTALKCQRVYVAAGTTVCLRLAGIGPSYEAAVLDAQNQVVRTVALPGTPSRARVSQSGKVISWTTFVTGDSYSVPGGFSTRTGVLDLNTGTLVESLETFSSTVGGQVMTAADINYWGVTVAKDDRTFYATMATAGRTWLMKGDLVTRTMADVRQTAECPSLSPDGTKVAYKKRTSRTGPWRLAVTDLGTGSETVIEGTTGVDDQAAWLDDGTLVYAATNGDEKRSSIYKVPADGTSAPQVLITSAASPVPVH
ncbi:hypothetical protein BBK82_46425 [Lentzea guizhouensis]|uniref:TolB n=1 Tax=Lentzea guizhouensis TaxID=1586287 RepID=A0A1B2HX27_9PSEU|nr:hypothetical protein [Lentzea guizhouensis]ANZ42266.1 hypothetical protein BBK82_46425 [Lentzea guizhouensis]